MARLIKPLTLSPRASAWAWMVEQGAEALQGDGWKATWKNVVSSRCDAKRSKDDHTDLYGQYSRHPLSSQRMKRAST